MNYKNSLEQVAQYVLSMFDGNADHSLHYHNKAHTKFVVDSTIQIANHYQLDDKDFFIVVAAAWFHDTGYLVNRTNHEEESVRLADTYLKSVGMKAELIAEINQCIMATEMPQNPQNKLSEILCDADMFHLGQDDFREHNKQLKKEIEEASGKEMSKEEWRLSTISFFEAQHYFTDYCNLLLNDKKNQNLEKLVKHKPDEEKKEVKNEAVVTEKKNAPEKAKNNKNRPEKGIETMFRITSGNNQRLSDMADGKAHILITVNSIILSAIISLVLRKLDTNNFLIVPTFMLLTVSVLSIIFSILATRPNVPKGVFSMEEIEDKKVNLLFFGNFYRMRLADYTTGMEKIMEDKDLLYSTLIMDVYSQGVVLGRKYRQLRVAYNIFMFGLVISVVAFSIASILHTGPQPIPR